MNGKSWGKSQIENARLHPKRRSSRSDVGGASGVTLTSERDDSWSAQKTAEHAGKLHRGKPDADNIAKAVPDALLAEDKTVAFVTVTKCWCEQGDDLITDVFLLAPLMRNAVSDVNPEQRFVQKIGSSVIAITGGFVYLDAEGNDSVDMQTFSCSAFAMSFNGVPVLVTAGHVIRDVLDPIIVRNEYEGHPLRLLQVNLLDCFGEKPLVKRPTPFPVYPDLRRVSIDEATKRDSMGLDFGVIFLPDLYWEGFFANDGRILAENMWAQEGETFDVYKMVGIPAEPQHSRNGHGRLGVFSFLAATDPDVPIRDGKPVWFVGNMPEGMTSVTGVSGGPIFGLRRLPTGGWEHKIVAMQSWQKEGKNGLVYGTWLRSFGSIVSHAIATLIRTEATHETL